MKNLCKHAARLMMAFALATQPIQQAAAFDGSTLEGGKKFYLFNIYQAKFLNADNKLTTGEPVLLTAEETGFTINGTTYTATQNTEGFYQLKSAGKYFAFEDKVADPESPTDENRAMYKGGGVTCQLSSNNTDRSHWMLISEEEYAEWEAKKKFTVASLNVDGMPKSVSLAGNEISLNPDAKEEAGGIAFGKKLLTSGFDIIGVSEDFNYHSQIWDNAWNNGEGVHYNATTHRGIISVGNANLLNYLSQSPLFDTDGLCLFYKVGAATPSDESFVKWNDHYGYTDNGADGLIKKGYRYYLITLADGTEIDLYTMHMDAEASADDNAARASQLTQLVTAIKATNNKRPIVIIGDSNCRYTRDKVKTNLIDAINADERFTIRDPWIHFGRNDTYPAYGTGSIMASTEGYLKGEVVDKIWYINNKESDIRLVAETYAQDLSFVDEEGSPLCDHKPCVVTFSYHAFDPETDDKPVTEISEEPVFLRNRETGRYLMNGGWWGSHAVVGNYGKDIMMSKLPNGKYDISTPYGHITDAAYVDNNNPNEYIKEWNLIEEDGYVVLSYNQNGINKALTTNDPAYFNDNPLYRYVTTAPLNVKDKHQQWEIVTKEQMEAEMAKANPVDRINVTHLIKSANFDRIDWNEHGEWKFTNNASNYVTDNGIGGADNDAFCNFNRSISTKTYGTISRNNTWDLYQTLSVKPGYYVVTCQGFVQEGNADSQNVKFYAWSNPEGEYVMNAQTLASYRSVAEADRPTSGNQTSAARAFDKNLYINTLPVTKVGTDGVLVIGAKKDERTKSNTTWTVVDNFQLFYLGDTDPAEIAARDVNNDGKIDADDVAAIIRIILEHDATDLNTDAADVDKNGSITIKDATELIEKIITRGE